jgi:hypothetical protein
MPIISTLARLPAWFPTAIVVFCSGDIEADVNTQVRPNREDSGHSVTTDKVFGVYRLRCIARVHAALSNISTLESWKQAPALPAARILSLIARAP